MGDWREQILEKLDNRSGLFVAIDPDYVLASDQKLLSIICDLKFDILRYRDPIEFRYEYEIHKSENTLNLIIIWNNSRDLAECKLTWEILNSCQLNQSFIDCSAASIFPKLASNVIEQIPVSEYDTMHEKYLRLDNYMNEKHLDKKNLNEDETCEFILTKIYDQSPYIIANSTTSLFCSILKIHYNSKKLPKILIQYLSRFVNQNDKLSSWNVEELLSDKNKFFNFVQNEWSSFVNTRNSKIDFQDKNVYVLLDNLFLEEFLVQVETSTPTETWMKFGIKSPDDQQIQKERFQDSLSLFKKDIDELDVDSRSEMWRKVAVRYGKLMAIAKEQSPEIIELKSIIQKKFEEWIYKHYKNLRTMIPLSGPIMVHHIIDYLSSLEISKIALVIIDGISIVQWNIIEGILKQKKSSIQFKTDSIFAWIPTITSISRQGIFCGSAPDTFSDILTTSYEETGWKQKWHQEKPGSTVLYSKINNLLQKTDISPNYSDYNIIGLVTTDLDDYVHEVKGGMNDLNDRIRYWAENSSFADLLEQLAMAGFDIFISSDHGNIEAMGIGEPKKDLGMRGRRCRIYDNQDKQDMEVILRDFPECKDWWPEMVGEKYYFLLASENYAFSKKGELVVTHGGMSFDEVMVPFVRVSKIA